MVVGFLFVLGVFVFFKMLFIFQVKSQVEVFSNAELMSLANLNWNMNRLCHVYLQEQRWMCRTVKCCSMFPPPPKNQNADCEWRTDAVCMKVKGIPISDKQPERETLLSLLTPGG